MSTNSVKSIKIANPLFSIIISLYNKEQSIRNTISSILKQTYDNFEILVIDDGSTDNSLTIVKKTNDSRIKVFSKINGGVSSARNYGINKAKGTYILFLDADDILLPNCLSVYYDLIMNYPSIKVFSTNFNIINTDNSVYTHCKKTKKSIITNPYKELYLRKIYIRTGNTLIHSSCFDEIGLFNENLSCYEDLEFNIRLLDSFQQIVYSPEVTFTYIREHSNLSTINMNFNNEFISIAKINNGNFYKKLFIAEHITQYLTKLIVKKDWSLLCKIFKKHIKQLHFLILSFILIQIKRIQNRIHKN
jgi:glycosyltransferase involved in cell wall biosynthesis